MIYSTYIHRTSHGYNGFFPEFTSCIFSGASLEEALSEAYRVLKMYLKFSLDEGWDIPEGHPVERYLCDKGFHGGIWAYVTIDVPQCESKSKRIQIAIPDTLLEKIDLFTEKTNGIYTSRSCFFALAARHLLADRYC